MKANELNGKDLMIGDYVYGCIETDIVGEATYRILCKVTYRILCKVKEINDYGDIVSQCIEPLPDELDWQDGNDFSWIEPVPLTDGILKKNGFEYNHKNFCSLNYQRKVLTLEMTEWPDADGSNGLWVVCNTIEIRFVHELQLTLKLCKIDKTIEL